MFFNFCKKQKKSLCTIERLPNCIIFRTDVCLSSVEVHAYSDQDYDEFDLTSFAFSDGPSQTTIYGKRVLRIFMNRYFVRRQ